MLAAMNDGLHSIDWELIQRLSQITFFVVTAVVAVLTFKAAKKGLLNTVYNEYHKRVIDNLAELSANLYDEFDMRSEHSWQKRDDHAEVIRRVNEAITEFESLEVDLAAYEHLGVPLLPIDLHVFSSLARYESDPFLPNSLRGLVTSYFQHRRDMTIEGRTEVVVAFGKRLAAYKAKPIGSRPQLSPNALNDAMYARGVGISDLEKRSHEIRKAITQYFSDFDTVSSNAPNSRKVRGPTK